MIDELVSILKDSKTLVDLTEKSKNIDALCKHPANRVPTIMGGRLSIGLLIWRRYE